MSDTRIPRERQSKIVDKGSLHKYRTEIPNTVVRGMRGLGLSLPARWLYVYLKSVAGEDGECWQNTTTIANGAQIGRGTVTSAKSELIAKKLIAVTPGHHGHHDTDKIVMLDIWDENMREFATGARSGGEHASDEHSSYESAHNDDRVHLLNAVEPNGPERVQEVNAVVQEVNAVVQEVNSLLIGIKKNPLEEDPREEVKTPPLSPAGGKRAGTKAAKRPATDYTTGFELVWRAYPAARKEGKVETFAIWQQRDLEPRAIEIAEKLERLAVTLWHGREKRYIPMPATWFNQARYEDELITLDVVQEQQVRQMVSDKTLRSIQNSQRIMEDMQTHETRRPGALLPGAQYHG